MIVVHFLRTTPDLQNSSFSHFLINLQVKNTTQVQDRSIYFSVRTAHGAQNPDLIFLKMHSGLVYTTLVKSDQDL